jgi:hypothetical protein
VTEGADCGKQSVEDATIIKLDIGKYSSIKDNIFICPVLNSAIVLFFLYS